MPVLMYIQSREINNYAPDALLAPLTNRFNAVTTYQAGNFARTSAFFSAALSAGYETYLWVSPGYPPAGLPAAYNCQNIWATYPQSWTAMHLAACRTWLYNYWTAIAQPYVAAGLLTGIQLDYIRYPPCAIYDYPPQSAANITAVVNYFRTWCNARGLDLIASVRRGRSMSACGGSIPTYEASGQEWPTWIDDGIIDYCHIMSYSLNYWGDPDIEWANQPVTPASLVHQRPVLDPAGLVAGWAPTPTWEEWQQELQWCEDWPYPETPSQFDWYTIDEANRWDWIPELEDEPPPPAAPPPPSAPGYLGLAQKRPSELLDLIRADVQMRAEPNFAWKSAVSSFLSLPALRGFWPMSSVDYTTANRCIDVSGHGYHLTDNGTVTFGYDGLIPYAGFVSASNQYLSRADGGAGNWADILATEAYIVNPGLTIGGWFWFSDDASTHEYCMSKSRVAGDWAYILRRSSTGEGQFLINDGALEVWIPSARVMSGETWYFLVGRFVPSTSICVWLNRDKTTLETTLANIQDESADFYISGRNAVTPDYLLNGRASMCFLCAAALSDTIINTLFEQTRVMFNVL